VSPNLPPLGLPVVAGLTVDERIERGRTARKRCPRSTVADWAPAADRVDPVSLLEQQNVRRDADLLPLRHQRMSASPFAFYRGSAIVMAADVGAGPHSGLVVQLCGDAHLANFGGFAAPDRQLVYDLNDFDETHPGPFEWDVQRLAASVVLAARHRGFSPEECRDMTLGTVRTYREAMSTFAAMSNLDVFYSRLDSSEIERWWAQEAGAKSLRRFEAMMAKGETKDRLRAQAKLTELVDGRRQFLSQPPLLVPADELTGEPVERVQLALDVVLAEYRETLPHASRRLLDRYRPTDLARKVVGVGSVGTRCWVALFEGRDDDDPLFLQVKEANASVLEQHTTSCDYPNHGQRVVEGQRLIQATTDVLLGWHRGVDFAGGGDRDYYARQLWDWKTTANLDTLRRRGLDAYSRLCGQVLARAHARSGDPVAIGAYLGTGVAFDEAMTTFAHAYADQAERDHASMVEAIESGRLVSEPQAAVDAEAAPDDGDGDGKGDDDVVAAPS
jgi:uncharacterized protein (DUF2252 family)